MRAGGIALPPAKNQRIIKNLNEPWPGRDARPLTPAKGLLVTAHSVTIPQYMHFIVSRLPRVQEGTHISVIMSPMMMMFAARPLGPSPFPRPTRGSRHGSSGIPRHPTPCTGQRCAGRLGVTRPVHCVRLTFPPQHRALGNGASGRSDRSV